MNSFKRSQPWFATESILRSYLARAVPYLTGRMLDAGCGQQRYKDIFRFESYVGVEYDDKFKPDVVADLRHLPFDDNEFDSILNNQVLEHIDDTHAVMSELTRVLKPGGYLCITVPFIGRLHGEPHDYWRMTEHGIRYLFRRHGLEEVEILNMGGFFTTQMFLWQFWIWERLARFKVLRAIRAGIMYVTNPMMLLVHKLDRDRSTPFNYLAIGRKRDALHEHA